MNLVPFTDCTLSLTWRSMTSGDMQFGNGWLFSHLRTLEITQSETVIYDRRPDGIMTTWTLDNGTYITSDCSIHDSLVKNGSGFFEIQGKYGDVWEFDANGMPSVYEDSSGNALTYTFSGYLWTGFTDDRGKSYTIHHDGNDRIDYIEDPTGRRWTFGYTSGNLTTITTPVTPDQEYGITTTFTYDGSNRLTDVQDGRSNTWLEYSWVTGTSKVDTATLDGDDVTFTQTGGRTDRKARNGNVHRIHFSGQNITKTEMYIDSQAEYVTTYAYSGSSLITIVYPRGNRVDLTWDGSDNLTARRRKTTDTANTDASDIVESWTYSNNFVATYTDPLGEVTTYTRNGAGLVTEIDHPDVTYPASQTASSTRSYNGYGQVLTSTDEEGTQAAFTYVSSGDDVGLLYTVSVDPAGLNLTTTYGYDDEWNVDSVTDPRGHVTETTWDALRRRVEVELRLIRVTGWTTRTVADVQLGETQRMVFPPFEFSVTAEETGVVVSAYSTDGMLAGYEREWNLLSHRWAAAAADVVDSHGARLATTVASGSGGFTSATYTSAFDATADVQLADPVSVTLRVPATWEDEIVRYAFTDLDLAKIPPAR